MKLPSGQFMLFGMGARRKLLYKAGVLRDALTGETLRRWEIASEQYEPAEYRVTLQLQQEPPVQIEEDGQAVWIAQNKRREAVTSGPVHLPRFNGSRAGLLRRLHHEILVNIVSGKPVPNLWVYAKPWYRDAAMMLLCLERTGNLALVKDWILELRDPFDRNNVGHEEPDNLGQALWMIGQISDASHPLVQSILNVLPRFEKTAGALTYIEGLSDFAPHPVYQTKWLKYGLRALHLPDKYAIPPTYDNYSRLFWMDYQKQHVDGAGVGMDDNYPYLSWAEAHFRHAPPPAPIDETQSALSWEAHASQADYGKMALLGAEYVTRRISAPHTWHAAEMFLYLLDAPHQAGG